MRRPRFRPDRAIEAINGVRADSKIEVSKNSLDRFIVLSHAIGQPHSEQRQPIS